MEEQLWLLNLDDWAEPREWVPVPDNFVHTCPCAQSYLGQQRKAYQHIASAMP